MKYKTEVQANRRSVKSLESDYKDLRMGAEFEYTRSVDLSKLGKNWRES